MKFDARKVLPNSSLLSPEVRKEVLLLETEAQEEIVAFASRLKNVTKIGAKTLEESLNESSLTDEEQNKTKEIFEQTILQGLNSLAMNIPEHSLRREGSTPLNIMLLKVVIGVLDIIQDFKMKIDKILPIKCDEIIKYATPVLLLVTSIYAPVLGIVLQNTGALEKVTSFLQDDKLKSTIYKLRETLGNMNQQKGLDIVNKTAELSARIGVLPTMIGKLGLGAKILETVILDVEQTPALKSFVKEVSTYADRLFPQNEKEIDETLQFIKKSAISSMEKTGVPRDLVEKVGKQIDEHVAQVKVTLQKTLDPAVSVFDKIKIQQNSANMMLDCINDVTNTIKSNISNPKDANLVASTVVKALQNEINNCLRGSNIDKIESQVQVPKIREFAKKTLGAGHANLMDIGQGAMKSLGVGSSRSI